MRELENGRTFATVVLEIETHPKGVHVHAGSLLTVSSKSQAGDRHWYTQWISAARQGATTCASQLMHSGIIPGCRITIHSVVGSDRDTTINAMFCASAIATWKGVCPDWTLPEVDDIDGRWVPYLRIQA